MNMKSFSDRAKGQEAAFQHKEERAFRVTARRNRLFGLWAASRLGLAGEDAEAYAMVVVADLARPATRTSSPGSEPISPTVSPMRRCGGNSNAPRSKRTGNWRHPDQMRLVQPTPYS